MLRVDRRLGSECRFAARLQSEKELTGLNVDSRKVRAAFHLLARVNWPRTLPHPDNDTFDWILRVQDALWRHRMSGRQSSPCR